MEEIIREIFDSPWWLVLALAIYWVSWSVYSDLFEEGRANRRWVYDLEQDSWAKWYRTTVNRALDWVDKRLTPDIARKRWPSKGLQVAFSSGLFGFCLLLALTYPALAMISQWGMLNTEGRIAGLLLVDDRATRLVGYGKLGLLATCLTASLVPVLVRGRVRLPWFYLVYGLVLSLAVAVACAFVAIVAGAGTFAFALAFTFAGTLAFAFAGANTGILTVVLAGAVAVTYEYAYAYAYAFAYAYAYASSGAFALVLAYAYAWPVAFALVVFQLWLGWRLGREALTQGVFVALFLFTFGVALAFYEFQTDYREEAFVFIALFLCLLPLTNGAADFLSVGATRYTLRRGARDDATTWAWMLADIGIGFAIFLALGCLILLYIQVFQLPTGPMIDARALLADIRAQPLHYWWLYIMLFSTMLPTALHLAVASFGSVLKISPWLRAHVAEGLTAGAAGDKVRGRWAVQWLCLSMTVTVMAPVFLVGSLWVNADVIGIGLLDFFGWVQDGVERVPKFETNWTMGWAS
ncbi:MAG: hypothetical protein AAF503_12590 [Pseudomonadota bacterium]